MIAPADVLAQMLATPNFRGGFPTGTLCSMLQTAGGVIRTPSGNCRFPPRPKTSAVLSALRKLEKSGEVVCLGRRYDVHRESCWKGGAARDAELLWEPSATAVSRAKAVQP